VPFSGVILRTTGGSVSLGPPVGDIGRAQLVSIAAQKNSVAVIYATAFLNVFLCSLLIFVINKRQGLDITYKDNRIFAK